MKDQTKNSKQVRACGLNSKPLLALALLAASIIPGWSAVVVQFGGDMVTSTAQMVLPSAINNGATKTYAYGGTSTALTPTTGGYAGPGFFGALQNVSGTGVPTNFSRTRIADSGTIGVADELDVWGSSNGGVTSQTNSITALICFKPTLSAGQTAAFTSGDSISMNVGFSLATTKEIRMAVVNDGIVYLSQTVFATANATMADASLALWGAWDPSGAPIPAEPTSFTTLGSTFTNIQGIGFYGNGSYTSVNTNQARIVATSFLANATITTVPEPSTDALMGLSAVGMVLYVKRRRRLA